MSALPRAFPLARNPRRRGRSPARGRLACPLRSGCLVGEEEPPARRHRASSRGKLGRRGAEPEQVHVDCEDLVEACVADVEIRELDRLERELPRGQVRLVAPPGAFDLNRGAVDREHPPLDEPVADHRRRDAGAAADLEHAIPGLDHKRLDRAQRTRSGTAVLTATDFVSRRPRCSSRAIAPVIAASCREAASQSPSCRVFVRRGRSRSADSARRLIASSRSFHSDATAAIHRVAASSRSGRTAYRTSRPRRRPSTSPARSRTARCLVFPFGYVAHEAADPAAPRRPPYRRQRRHRPRSP
jgi:hypothetical protein